MLRSIPIVLLCCSFSLPSAAQSIWDYFLPEADLNQMKTLANENGLEYSPMEILLVANKQIYQVETLTQFLNEHPKLNLNALFGGKHLIAEMLWIERFDLANLLIERGCDPNFLNEQGYGAIHDAINNNNLPAMRFLFGFEKVNVNLFSSDKAGRRTPLMRAMIASMDVFNEILNHPNLDPNLQDASGISALHIAVRHGDLQKFDALLLKPGIDLNICADLGATPLHVAITVFGITDGPNVPTETRLKIACNLFSKGANHLAQLSDGTTPMVLAQRFGLAEMILLFSGCPVELLGSATNGLLALFQGSGR